MPLYEYQCAGCGETFEVLQRLGEDSSKLSCPVCGRPEPDKVFSTFSASSSASHGDSAAPGCGSGGFS